MKAIVLHSGGMDSTVSMLLARERGRDVVSLGIDYGQRAQIELQYAEEICKRFTVPRKVIAVRWDKPERQVPTDRSPEEMPLEVSSAFVPGRNAVFLCLGCAEAVGIGAGEVWIGINCIDYSGYPDCTEAFVGAFREMVRLTIPDGPEVVTPLLKMSKPEIAREARRLGIEERDTWSCYTPVADGEVVEPCGRCDACVLHRWAWQEALKRSA